MKLFEKRALSAFKYSDYLPLSQKAEKTNELFLRKIAELTGKQAGRQAGRQTDRQTERQTDESDFIGSSIKQGSNKTINGTKSLPV